MSLRLLFDEQTPRETANRLSEHFDVERVVTVSELGSGTNDDVIWRYAVEHDRNVVSEDPHFIDGEADPGEGTYPGVIFCTNRSPEVIHDAVRELGRYYSTVDLADRQGPVYVPGRWS